MRKIEEPPLCVLCAGNGRRAAGNHEKTDPGPRPAGATVIHTIRIARLSCGECVMALSSRPR